MVCGLIFASRYGKRVRRMLDDGEASCVVVALERGAVLYTDNLLARSCAQQRGIDISGTLGVLAGLIAKDHLDVREADRYLREMIAHGYRSPVGSLGDLDIPKMWIR